MTYDIMHENLKWSGTYSGFGENVVKIEVGVVFKQEIISLDPGLMLASKSTVARQIEAFDWFVLL